MGQISDPLIAAIIGFSGALLVGFINSFWIEHYRRYQNRIALAGALAGELSSYSEGFHVLSASLNTLLSKTVLIEFKTFDKPSSKVFDCSVKEIGILGPSLAEDVAYVYNNLEAYNVANELAAKAEDLPFQKLSLNFAIASLERIQSRDLPNKLHECASKSYFAHILRFNMNWLFYVGVLLLGFFVGVA